MFLDKSAKFLADAVKNGEVKAVDIAKEFIDYVKKADKKIDAFNSINEQNILKRAEEVDEKRSSGEELGELAGVPFIIKDNILLKDEPVTCSSKMMEGYKAVYDATVVRNIKNADGIPFGKSNLDEFAMGSSTENSATKITKNPFDISRVPGGSSGGSSAAVAALMAPLSLGSDTGGSIRQPAAFCGLVGLKPTYGRVSRYGLVSFGSSLDQIGPFGRSAECVALAMNSISGYDKKDSTSAKTGVSNYLLSLNNGIKGLKVGILKEELLEGVDESIVRNLNDTVDVLKELGAEVKTIGLGNLFLSSLEAYYVIAPSEVSSNLSRFDGIKYGLKYEGEKVDNIYFNSRTQGLGDEVKRRIMIGNYVLNAGHYDSYHKKAYQVRRVIKDEFDKVFKDVDVILMPTTPTVAFKIGENVGDPLKMYLSDLFTTPVNLSGLPALSFPSGSVNGLPIGMQLVGKNFSEGLLLNVVSSIEKVIKKIEFRRIDV